jgi:MSHA biogenesis protein MshQ
MNNILKCEKHGLNSVLFRISIMFLWVLSCVFGSVSNAYAAPAFQAAGAAVTGTGTVSPAWPTHATGDVALLFVESAGGQPVTLTTPAGFVAVTNSPQATGAGTAGTQISVFWARATSAAMTAPTVGDPGDHVYAQIITYRGVGDAGNPWDVTSGGVKATASTSVTVTGVTTTVANTLIVQVVSRDNDSAAAAFSAEANGTLTGIAERSDAGTTSSNGGGFAVWDGVKATAGATGNTTATVTSSANAFMTIALKYGTPTVTTNAATALSGTGATLNGTVSSNGSSTAVTFDYGLTTGYGSTVSATPSPLAAGASGTAVSAVLTGLTCNTLYHYRVNGVNTSGTTNGGDLTFATSFCPFTCAPPSNVPAGVTVSCQCDTFARASLNPSPIFTNANWIATFNDATGILPSIVNSGYLRLTNNTGNNAKSATVPGIFPAAGNYISVEFQQYAYNGTGADGIAVTLSDYSVPPVPGAYGGSLGYAQETGIHDGFAGGWLGVGLDEYGNYQNPNEGRIGGPGFIVQSVGARGSGSGQTGYNWLGGSGVLSPTIDNRTSTTASYGYFYQVVVDARNDPASTAIVVRRDTGGGYADLINIPNVYTAANAQGFIQAAVPANWQISFTGSTGGSNNIHEIGSLRICASTMVPPGGGSAGSFNAIDEAYGTPPLAVQNYLSGHIYTKLVGTSFKLNVAALSNSQILTTYALAAAKTVTVKLVDNSDGVCILDSAQTSYCNASCTGKTGVTGGTQPVAFTVGATDKGQKQSPSFTINSAYQNLVAIISDGTTTACSTDSFAVRPLSIASVTSSNATNTGTTGTPIFKAGSGNFALTATTTGIVGSPSGYTGVLKINNAVLASSATYAGTVSGTFPAATSATSQSTATGTTFTYSEVGGFTLPGYALTDTTSRRGVYDGVSTADECALPVTPAQCDLLRAATWTGVDSISTKNDCVLNSYSNVRDVTGTLANNPNFGKFGCNFGLVSTTAVIGRFVPDHFDTVVNLLSSVPMLCPTGLTCPTYIPAYSWSYADAPARLAATGFVSTDIGNFATQLDNTTTWLLMKATTPMWSQLGSGFVYSGQPFTLQIIARNATGAATRNYDNATSLSKATTLSAWNAVGAPNIAANSNPGGGTLSGFSVAATAFSLGIGTTTSTPIYTFPTTPVAPADVYIRATDTDNVTSLRAASSVEGGLKVVSGRMKVSNAYGSELLPLSITAAVQYYNAAGAWVNSTTDNVTSFNPTTNLVPAIVKGPLVTSDIVMPNSTVTVASGVKSVKINAPGVTGSADISLGGIGAPGYLLTGSNNAAPAINPSVAGRVTFGIYAGPISKGKNEFIYMRELY